MSAYEIFVWEDESPFLPIALLPSVEPLKAIRIGTVINGGLPMLEASKSRQKCLWHLQNLREVA